MTDKENLGLYDLYNSIKLDVNGPNSIGYTQFSGTHNELSRKDNFVDCVKIFNYILEDKKIHRSYVVGYCLSHEFLHQILRKAFFCIFDWEKYPSYSMELMFRRNESHVAGAKNLLFPGDGLGGSSKGYTSGDQFLLPKDKTTGQYVATLYFFGDYVPKQNMPNTTNEWEHINYNHKGLIYRFWLFKLVESTPSVTQEDLNWLKKLNTHEIKDYDFSTPW